MDSAKPPRPAEQVPLSAARALVYAPGKAQRPEGPIRLGKGPHLFLDDFLIESSEGMQRKVNVPQRDPAVPNPVVTGKEDGCFQPYMTVLRDPATGRFRIWYGCRREDRSMTASHVGYMESDDGIRWLRPHCVLRDPAPIQFGSSVIDDGPGFPEPAKRFKLGWWHGGGLCIAASPDGLDWKALAPGVVLPHNHDITGISWDPIRKRYFATVSVYIPGPWRGRRRVTMQSTSQDLLAWTTPHHILVPDLELDEGETQFYAMDGYLVRGGLLIGMVKVLRDDLKAAPIAGNGLPPPDPPDQFGIGYTTLAWSRDGETWVRDRTPFFDRDPREGAWDHAHAWIDEQLPVGDQVYLYYGGYKRGHKVNRFEERQIGLVRMPRDRYVAREAGGREPVAGNGRGRLVTPPLILDAEAMTLNVAAKGGEARVEVLDEAGKPLPGLSARDCSAVADDSLAAPVVWKQPLGSLRGRTIRLAFSLRNARLFAFDLK